MEITKMLTLSTAHITKETAKILESGDRRQGTLPPYFPKGDYGWFFYVDPDYLCVHSDGRVEEMYPKTSGDLHDCLREAWREGCNWLCLDSDGLVVEDDDYLPVYVW